MWWGGCGRVWMWRSWCARQQPSFSRLKLNRLGPKRLDEAQHLLGGRTSGHGEAIRRSCGLMSIRSEGRAHAHHLLA